MVGLGWHMVVNRTSGQRGANEQHYDGPTLDSDVGPTIRTPEDQRRPNVVLLSGIARKPITRWYVSLYYIMHIFKEAKTKHNKTQ